MNPKTKFTIINKPGETFEIIQRAVNKMVDTIKPTFGPASNKVIIDRPIYSMIVDDGVQIARDFELDNPLENAVIKKIKETAIKTNDRVGDGTTGALIILQAIINEVAKKSRFDGRKIELELKRGLEEAKLQLMKSAKQIKTKEELKKVALVAFDNEKMAEIVAGLYFKLGKDAAITVDYSQTMETEVENTEGIKLDVGYISPYMINNPQRMEAILENPFILLTDYRLTESSDIFPIMEKIQEAKKNPKEKRKGLILVCENVEHQALSTIVLNLPTVFNPQTRQLGSFPAVAIGLPKVEDRKTLLEDLAILTGAKMFTQEKGDKLENVNIADLGSCEKFICRKEESFFIKPKGNRAGIASSANMLKYAIDGEKDDKSKKVLQYRYGLFTNTMAIIKVGAPTDAERKPLKYKTEDMVNAVKSAYKSGVVCGAGLSLAKINTSSPILNEALKAPAKQLLENVGIDGDWQKAYVKDSALNVVTMQEGHFLDIGVVDPVEVLIAGCESAISIASVLLTSSGMVVESQRLLDDNKENQ